LASRAALLLLIAAAGFSPVALAHGKADWTHGMLDGALLFFTSLESLLPVLMVALLVRRQGLRNIIVQAAALGIGLLGAFLSLPSLSDPTAVGLYARGYLVALGLLVLVNLRLHSGVVMVLVLAAGTLTGLEAGNAVVVNRATGFAFAVGFLSSVISVYMAAALIVSRYTAGWQRIAMRVMASWIVAIATIDIAFMVAPPD
jgi:hypothetical protein